MAKDGCEKIKNIRELEFAIFCIENVAGRLGESGEKVFYALTVTSNILYDYIIPCYETLHTQDKEYIVDDILGVMEERGVRV